MVSNKNKKFAKTVFLFTMLNPGIIYINYIWVQLDIFPVFFVALSYYYIYYYEKRDSSFIYSLISLIPLFIAIFSFYYAVLIIPTIIFYSRSSKQVFNFVVSSLLLGISLYIAELLLFRGGGENLIGVLVPSSNALYYQGLQRVITIPAPYLIISIGLISLFIPLFLRKYKFSPSVPIFFIILAILYTSTNAAANNFLWLYPFSFLSIFESAINVPRKYSILITSSFFWTGILFINLYIGTGIQAGLFYFAYNVFHENILFIHTNYQWVISTLIYFAVLSISLAITIVYVFYFISKNPKPWQFKEFENREKKNHLNLFGDRKKTIKICLISLSLVVLLLISVIFNSTVPVLLNDATVHEAPTEVLLAQYSNGVVAFPVLNNTYFDTGNSISFYHNSNLIQMKRNLSAEFINLSIIEKIHLSLNSYVELVNTSDFQIFTSTSYFLNLSNYNIVVPSFTNDRNLSKVSVPSTSRSIQVADLNTNNSIIYNSEYFSSSCYYTMLFKVQHNTSPTSIFNQTVLFGLYNGNTSVDFVVYNKSGILSYNDGNVLENIPVYCINSTADGWNLLTLKSTGNALNVSINGRSVLLTGFFFGGESKLYVGKQQGNDSSHSFTGWVSELYGSSANCVTNRIFDSIISGKNRIIYVNGGNEIRVNISDSQKGTLLTLQEHSISYHLPISDLIIGKLNPIPYSLSITFNWLHIMARDNGGYFMIPVFFAFSVPYISAAIGLIEIYYTRLSKEAGSNFKDI